MVAPYFLRAAAALSSTLSAQVPANTSAGAATATTDSNGLFNNPYDSTPLPYHWPGTPTNGETSPGPKPPTPFPYGGASSDAYLAPAWVPKTSGAKLVPALPKESQVGNSPWGELDLPHLPLSLPGASYPKLPTSFPGWSSGSSATSGPTTTGPTSTSSTVGTDSTTGPTSSASTTLTQIPTGDPGFNSTLTTSGSTVSLPTGSPGTSPTTTAPSNPTTTDCPTMPDTGVTRTYNFDVAYQTIAPDGVTRNGLLVNGQFPGPLVEANWGDWIEFQVTNSLRNEGTTIHPHGLLQKDTPWYDGVPSVSQCPISPNGSFTQTFRADRYGTSWYHSHYSAQYSGGAQGPMVIYGPKNGDYDIDIGPVFMEDWYHADYYTLVQNVMVGNFPPSNNNLINGKMNYPCANTTLPCTPNAGVSKFQFQRGKKHLLRLINAGAEGLEKFSIDGHTLTVVANDFVPIKPYQTKVVTLGIAQRTDVIVEANGDGDAFWMRAQLGTNGCTLNDGVSPNALAAVYYDGADTNAMPNTTSDVTAAQLAACQNDPLEQTVPVCPEKVADATTTEEINITIASNGTNFLFFMNNSSFRGDFNDPILLKVKEGNLTFDAERNVYDFGSNATVRMVLYNHALAGGHPMHLHGHDFQVLDEGVGTWDGTITNADNPLRRDVYFLPVAQDTSTPSYVVMQWAQDNPGAWPLHCHIAWHVSAGLFVTVLERPTDIMALNFDEDSFPLCDAWDTYSSQNPPDQIDSGLKEKGRF